MKYIARSDPTLKCMCVRERGKKGHTLLSINVNVPMLSFYTIQNVLKVFFFKLIAYTMSKQFRCILFRNIQLQGKRVQHELLQINIGHHFTTYLSLVD